MPRKTKQPKSAYIAPPDEPKVLESIERLRQGSGSAWIAIGPPGFGKSTLLHRVRQQSSGLPRLRRIEFTCSPSTEPIVSDLAATPPPLVDLPAGDRALPSTRAYEAVAHILLTLGREPLPQEAEEPTADLVMDPARIARTSMGAAMSLAVDAVLPLLATTATVGDALFRLAGVSERGELDLRRFVDVLYNRLDEATAAHPTLILVDDAHFLDEQSCNLLMRLAQRISNRPCMLVLSARDREMEEFSRDEPRHPLAGHVGRGTAQGWLQATRLGAWSRETATEYIALRFPGLEQDNELEEKLWTVTLGFPLFLGEVLSLLEESGHLEKRKGTWRARTPIGKIEIPARVEDAIAEHLRRVDTSVRATIERASVEGEQFHFQILKVLTAKVTDEVLRERLVAAEHYHRLIRTLADGTLDRWGGLFSFSHALVHDYVYSRLPKEAQRGLHALVADELVRLTGSTAGDLAPEVVRHSQLAGQWKRMVEYSLAVARDALRIYDWRTASRYANTALNVSRQLPEGDPRIMAGLHLARGEALYRLGQSQSATADLDEAVTLARLAGAPEVAADGLALQSHAAGIAGRPKEALDYAKRSLQAASEANDPFREIAGVLIWHRSLHSVRPFEARFPVYREHLKPTLERILNDARQAGNEAIAVRAIRWLSRVTRALGEDSDARSFMLEGLALAHKLGDYRTIVELYYLNIELEAERGDVERMLQLYEESLRAARLTGDAKMLTDLLCNYGQQLKEHARFDHARNCLAEALQLSERLGTAELLTTVHGNFASMLEAMGNWSEARVHHEKHQAAARGIDDVGGQISGVVGVARSDLEEGDPEKALSRLQNIVWPGRKTTAAFILEARALQAMGRSDEALRVLDGAGTESLEIGDPYWVGQLMLSRVELALSGLETGTLVQDADVAVRETRALSERWPASFPLRRERDRAGRLKAVVDAKSIGT